MCLTIGLTAETSRGIVTIESWYGETDEETGYQPDAVIRLDAPDGKVSRYVGPFKAFYKFWNGPFNETTDRFDPVDEAAAFASFAPFTPL